MRIAFALTADLHVTAFDQIFADLGAGLQLDHRADERPGKGRQG